MSWPFVSKLGKTFFANERRLVIHGDARTVLPEMPDEYVDMIHFDAPWSYERKQVERIDPGQKYPQLSDEDILACWEECFRILKPNCHAWAWVTAPKLLEQGDLLRKLNAKNLWKYKTIYTWHKCDFFGMGNYTRGTCEHALLFVKGGRTAENRSIANHCDAKATGHSHKPMFALGDFLQVSTKKSEIVLDPFMNIGGMGIATKIMERKFIGIDIEARFLRQAETNISQEILFTEA